ncbi:MAG: head-tail connector protein, partial [Hyphomicrobiales bacterium]|nr:head-tail connector protein [Hyphomicrobiales bacterium]
QDYDAGPAPLSPAVRFVRSPPAPGRAVAGIEIDVQAGFGPAAADVPRPLHQAVLLLVTWWYENRGDAIAAGERAIPSQIASLIAPWRKVRLA